jgi:hypothetical protein
MALDLADEPAFHNSRFETAGENIRGAEESNAATRKDGAVGALRLFWHFIF